MLSLTSALPAIYGLKQSAVGGEPLVPSAALVAGAVFGVAFVRRQLRLETPLLDLRLLRSRPFTAVLIALGCAGIAMAGTGLLVTQYLALALLASAMRPAVRTAQAADPSYETTRA